MRKILLMFLVLFVFINCKKDPVSFTGENFSSDSLKLELNLSDKFYNPFKGTWKSIYGDTVYISIDSFLGDTTVYTRDSFVFGQETSLVVADIFGNTTDTTLVCYNLRYEGYLGIGNFINTYTPDEVGVYSPDAWYWWNKSHDTLGIYNMTIEDIRSYFVDVEIYKDSEINYYLVHVVYPDQSILMPYLNRVHKAYINWISPDTFSLDTPEEIDKKRELGFEELTYYRVKE